MATKVHMEALSPTMEEGQVVSWLKSEGEEVAEGDILAEIETDKATMELVARGAGVLRKQLLPEGGTAPVGSVIGVIAAEDEDISELIEEVPDEAPEGDAEPGDDSAEDAPEAAAGDEAAAEDEAGAGAEAATEEVAAPEGEAASEAEVEPESAPEAEPEAEPEEAAAPGDGEEPGKREPARPSAEPGGKAGGEPTAGDGAAGGRVRASPLARRLADEAGLELSGVTGTGPGGRIVKRDIELAVEEGAPRRAAKAPAAAPARPAAPLAPVEMPEVEEVPVTQMRKTIARRLVTSIGPVPTFYLTVEADMRRMQELRARINGRLEERGEKVSLNDLIIKASAAALRRHPEVNAAWHEDVVRRYGRAHVGVAVAIDEGLITPVIRDADRKGVAEIAREVKELAGRARQKKLQPEEYTGATFSISNLGMFGIDEFTAIINPPEAAILAVGRVEEKPVVEDGEVVVRPRMRMTMSCDHRVVDGAMGARFLQTLKEFIEEPMMMVV